MDAPAQPVKTALRLLWPAVWVLALLAIALGALFGGAVWLLRTEGGTQWLLARLPGVQVSGLRGAFLSERFEAERVRIQWDGGKQSVTIVGLVGEGLVWQWRPQPLAWVGLDAAKLSARQVVVDTGPPSGKPLPVPPSLELPARVTVAALHVDELKIDQLEPLRHIDAAGVSLGVDGAHRVEQVQLEWDRLRVQASARIATTKPFALGGQAQIAPRLEGDAYAATLKAGGTLESLAVDATLRGAAKPGRAAPSADVQATVLPFKPWPLGALSATTEALDLALLLSSAPETRLSGRVQVQSQSLDAPIAASVQLDNALPGRWDERRLPLRKLVLELQGHARQRDRVELKDFDLTLGGPKQAAGRLRGHGQWQGDVLQLDTLLADVQPQLLDNRAAAILLSGPLSLRLRGLPSPDPAAASATTTTTPLSAELKATLDGRLAAAPRPVQVLIDAIATESRIELRQLRAQAGAALAQARATAQRGAGGDWQLATSGSLADFDPQPWWPGEPGSAWQKGSHKLSADWSFDVRLPAPSRKLATVALLQSLAGSGTLRVHDSLLAGVPLALDLTLANAPSKDGTPSSVRGELRLADNKLGVDGRADPAGNGAADRWRLDLDAPTLAALAPLLRLDPALAAWAPRAGSAQASLSAQGRWPQLRTEGQAQLKGLDTAGFGIGNGNASWRIDTGGGPGQPIEVLAELNGGRVGQQNVEQLHAELRGTLAEHKLLVSGVLPLAPPAAAEQLLGVRALSGTRGLLQGDGSWQADSAGGGRWRGRIARLAVGNWDGISRPGASADTPADSSWLDGRDLRAELQFDADGRLARIQADPGRVKLADAGSMRWDAVAVDLLGPAPNIDLRADIEPFAVAPLLARAQPTMGWSGDLRLAAKITIRAAERFDADVVIERRDGDLHISDENGTQLLGLTDLRLALAAHDGTWVFTQALAGRTLGEMAGAISVKTTPQRRWPTPDAPLEGVLEAHVASLGVWSAWVPPGWRLAGELRTSASIGGRFGAPQYTGSLTGSEIGVRNLLQGVNVTQGQVAIRLEGESAKIERFTLKGGDGTLTVTGGAEFGSAPNAKLHLAVERFRLLGRIDRQLTASGSADLALSAEQIKLDGKVAIDDGLFDTTHGDAPTLDDDVTVRYTAAADKSKETAPVPRPRRNLAVAVEVDLGERLRVRGRGLDTALRGQLKITTPGGRMAVQGTVSTENGTYKAYGQKLEIDRGIIAFSGSVENPRLDILALRPNIDTRVGVAIRGNLLTPRVQLYSETDMSDTNKLSWLVLGREPDGLGRTDTALLQRAAVALLAGEGEAPTDTLMRNLGLDELTVRQSDSEVRETVISLGKQLSRRWYVGYERGVNATTGTWQLIYRIAQRFTLRAQSGQENALDVIWTWKFDEVGPMRKSAGTPP